MDIKSKSNSPPSSSYCNSKSAPRLLLNIKKEAPDDEIKEYAETAMNELLGWYGYDKVDRKDTEGLDLGHFSAAPPASSSTPSPPPTTTADDNNNNHNNSSSDATEDGPYYSDGEPPPPPGGGGGTKPGVTIRNCTREDDTASPPPGSPPVLPVPVGCTACAWCQKVSGAKAFSFKTANGQKSFCSEVCFTQCRRASFKRNKTCDWCRHVRHTVNYVDFQDGDHQLQFCRSESPTASDHSVGSPNHLSVSQSSPNTSDIKDECLRQSPPSTLQHTNVCTVTTTTITPSSSIILVNSNNSSSTITARKTRRSNGARSTCKNNKISQRLLSSSSSPRSTGSISPPKNNNSSSANSNNNNNNNSNNNVLPPSLPPYHPPLPPPPHLLPPEHPLHRPLLPQNMLPPPHLFTDLASRVFPPHQRSQIRRIPQSSPSNNLPPPLLPINHRHQAPPHPSIVPPPLAPHTAPSLLPPTTILIPYPILLPIPIPIPIPLPINITKQDNSLVSETNKPDRLDNSSKNKKEASVTIENNEIKEPQTATKITNTSHLSDRPFRKRKQPVVSMNGISDSNTTEPPSVVRKQKSIVQA
ncbi:uncharacterized protein LOC142328012 isoform X2 [Lycorma delicatula]|uniref:uncharacterized protein LOC142328012 isoform X2 n=1 Tax=Lycorma delicatula TaxID=130591 RepID=UPI003F51A98D